MIIEDFVMLGRTVPEQSKKHGSVVCSAGYSKEMRQFLRIYPLSPFARVPRWSICTVPAMRNRHDSRSESWRLKKDAHPSITGKVPKADEFEWLKAQAAKSICELNVKRASLGVIAPKSIGFRFDGMRKNEEFLLPLFEEDNAARKLPRLQFHDDDGEHDLQLRDWGAHEFLRKQPDAKHHQLWDALKLHDSRYEHLFFVGNHNQHRNSWLVISVVSEKTQLQPQLFSEQ